MSSARYNDVVWLPAEMASTANQPQPDESGAHPVEAQVPKTRKALSGVKRELSEEDLATPGVQKMLIEELERAEEEISELKSYRERFHAADRDLAVVRQKLKGWTSAEMISTACIAVGAAALTYAPEAGRHGQEGWIAVTFGAVLTLIGVLAKMIKL